MAKGRGPAAQEYASEEEEEEENGSESEPELPDKSQPTPSKKSLTPMQTSHATSYDEEESGSDSPPDPNIKPIVSKPSAAKKLRSETNSSSGAGVKRPAVWDGQGKELKRSKKKGTANDESKKSFQRLWSEDDEIAVLNGLINFSANKKVDPCTNLYSFYDIIKESVHFDVTRLQLKDKIRKLRNKYNYNADKAKKGEGWILPKKHEQKCFALAKKVWGKDSSTAEGKLEGPKFDGEMVVRRSRSKNPKTPVNEVNDEEVKNSDGCDNGLEVMKVVNLGLGKIDIEEWIMENIQFVDTEIRAKMDKKLMEFKMVEAGVYVKKLELMLEVTNLVLAALKSSD